MLKPGAMAVAILLIPQIAQAQPVIDAGTQIQQIPPPPTPERPLPEIRVERPALQPNDGPAGVSIRVNALKLTGQTIFSEAELIAASGFAPGGDFNLKQLRQLAAKVSAYYNDRGYFLAQAYLPAQDINGGAVTIAVIEGRYGKIELRNKTNLRDGVARGVLDGLDSGEIVATAPLERRLLLLSDIPGVVIRSTLSPGEAVGTSNLAVDIDPGRRVSGSVEADNGGNHFTGAFRFGGSLNFNNPTGHGDLLSVRVLASTSGLAYGRAAYQTLLGNSTIGVAYSHVRYELGREFKSLDADGMADVVSLYGSHPLVRSRRANLYALGAIEAKFFEDRLGAAGTETHRRVKVLSFGVSGNHLDSFGSGGSNTYSIGASLGDLDIRSAADRAIDRATARSDGSYGKLQASVAREQNVTGPLSVYIAARGQLASKNLDSSEKMVLGGPYAVRAYPEGEDYGDEGYVATAEARMLLPPFALPGRLQLIGFVDVGAIRFAKNPWFTGPNVAHRSGVGAGLNWTAPNNFLAQAYYAHKLGNRPSTLYDDGDGRFWFRVAKLF
ncbi:MAG: ShlB/FhaC/HecB family hemolysin secretion/activation protein [Sphingomonas bacterium]|nr:ShlB/FhaC/HecB family hemolysin secretion/activation protein [Sphingomonas bacterium]